MRIARQLLLLVLWTALASCSDGGDSGNDACSAPQQNRFVHELFNEVYLWYQDVPPTIDYDAFPSPEATLAFLRNDRLDRFSNITETEAFDNLFSAGQFTGYGFSYTIRDDDSVWIRFVYTDSPAYRAGLRRSDQVLAVNNQPITDLVSSNTLNNAFGPATIGHPLDLLVRKPDTSTVNLTLQKDVVTINTVLHSSIIDTTQGPVGYLVFNSFLSTSRAEMETVFTGFNAAGIDRLVLDLRYNGGGSVAVANRLASHLNRVDDASQLFIRLLFNDKNQARNTDYHLLPLLESLQLRQLTIITTQATCSASEMVISGLQTYPIDIKTVGSSTCGKPVGMNPFNFCSKTILPVTFQSVNRNGEGDYFDGIAVDCAAADDVAFAFGETGEPMLSEALQLMENAQCSTQLRTPSLQQKRPRPLFPPASLRAIIGAI